VKTVLLVAVVSLFKLVCCVLVPSVFPVENTLVVNCSEDDSNVVNGTSVPLVAVEPDAVVGRSVLLALINFNVLWLL
jgi:hypothetical protein